jgi:hypothetical protein
LPAQRLNYHHPVGIKPCRDMYPAYRQPFGGRYHAARAYPWRSARCGVDLREDDL